MSTNAIPAQGTNFYIGDVGSPEGFVAVPEVRTIGGPNEARSTRDVTDLDSSAREFKLNLKDAGEVTLGIFYIPTNAAHAALRNSFNNGTLRRFRLEYADSIATYHDFSAYVTGWARTIDVDSDVTADVTLKITGDITEGS